ncbi:MAG: hypothetical protein M1130_12215 [Actinobacteria bacterium]|nr:hypothetical protein [Actinomycetota bacterium]
MGATSWHDFSGTGLANTDLYVKIPAGDSLYVVLQWNDKWGTSVNDYDLYLLNAGNGSELKYSENVQDGNDDPIEVISYTNISGSTIEGAIAVNKVIGATAKTLEVFIYPFNETQVYIDNITGVDSIFGHPAVPG